MNQPLPTSFVASRTATCRPTYVVPATVSPTSISAAGRTAHATPPAHPVSNRAAVVPFLESRMIMKRPRAPHRDSRRRRRPPSRPRRPGIAPRTVRLRLACRPVACVAAARTPFSITLHTPCRQSQRRHRLSTRENAAKLRLPHALDFPPPQITLVTTEMPVGASS